MSFMESMQALLDKVKQRGLGGQEEEQQLTSNMANGGFSGYKPATAKHRVTRETAKQQVVQEMPVEQAMPGYDMNMQQGMNYGFTGMQNDPWQQGMQATGYQNAAPQNVFQQEYPNQATGYQSAFGASYQQPQQYTSQNAWAQQPQQATGFQQAATGYQQSVNQPWQDQGFAPQQPYGMDQGYQQPQQDNISYMPGNFVGNDGRAYSHVERVAQLTQVSACYRIIEFMRNGESVIVNTEMMSDERENQRCLDLLYGAAFAMNCTLTRISRNKDIYLLSPATVMVVPYDSIRRMSDQDMSQRWPDPEQTEARYGFGESRQMSSFRERRENARRSGYTDHFENGFGSFARAR